MANPVWVLSVDLQTKTATFQSGMAEAARSARTAFNDIRSSAKDGGDGVTQSAGNVRAAIGLIDNTIRGSHAAAMADLVREFQDSRLVMAALPFAATIGGIAAVAAIAVEVAGKIKEWREEQERLRLAQMQFGTTVQETFNGLEEKILSAEQKSDELRNDHIGALGKQLELINRQSFSELIQSLETVAKAADTVFGDLKASWYNFGIGSAGASHALTVFKTQYDSLLAQGKDKEAGDLLAGTLTSAKSILAAQQQAKANSGVTTNNPTDSARVTNDFQAAYVKLKAAGVGYTQKEIEAQETLIKALDAQLTIEGKVQKLKGLEGGNAKQSTSAGMAQTQSAAAKEAADSQTRIGEMVIAADRATADAQLTIRHASIADRLASDIAFADRDLAVQLAGNTAQIAALDKYSKDYQNQLQALHDKTLELQQQRDSKVQQMSAQASAQQAALDVRNLQQSEREKIGATQQGSSERLAAIDAAIKEEQEHNLQNEDSYRQLLSQRVETVRDMAQQEAQAKAEAGRIAADNDQKLGMMAIAMQQEQQSLLNSGRRVTDQQRVEQETAIANETYAIQMTAFSQQIAALDKSGKDYENKLQELQNRQKQLTQQHENQITQIQDQATAARNQTILSAYAQFESSIAGGLSRVLTGQQSFASMMNSLASQVSAGLIQNALLDIMQLNMEKPHQAAAAARAAFLSGMKLPFPVNLGVAPVLGAAAFAAVMAYSTGTDSVPGMGRGDVVPAMLTPGEGVVPGGVMDGLRNVARNGGFEGGGQTVHVHVRPVYNLQALDGKGIDRTLKNHTATLTKHFNQQVRRMNR